MRIAGLKTQCTRRNNPLSVFAKGERHHNATMLTATTQKCTLFESASTQHPRVIECQQSVFKQQQQQHSHRKLLVKLSDICFLLLTEEQLRMNRRIFLSMLVEWLVMSHFNYAVCCTCAWAAALKPGGMLSASRPIYGPIRCVGYHMPSRHEPDWSESIAWILSIRP